jgi:thiol-disulfide isomerase/thioredoxin
MIKGMRKLAFALSICLAGLSCARPKGPAPDAAFGTVLQAPISSLKSLKDLQGQTIVLEFWATWCPPCVAGIPKMNSMVEAFQGRPVTFLSVTDERREDVERFLKSHPMKAWIALDPSRAASRAYGVRGIPAIFVIDRFGRIWHKLEPTFFWKSDIEDALNAAEPKP